MIRRHPDLTEELVPLHFLARGQKAEVGELVGTLEQIHRLHELGLRSGVVVEMVQSGSPCIVRLAGHKLCFRQSDVIGVLVRPGDES